jgi:putative ABC transport system substrate-binding protein
MPRPGSWTSTDRARCYHPRRGIDRIVDRRHFLLTSLAGVLSAPGDGAAQSSEKVARIAFLRSEHRPPDARMRQNLAALRAGLLDEGLTEGQHYRIDYHSPQSEADVTRLAQAVVRDKPDVIHASARLAIAAAQKATRTIPIVAHDYESDPVAAGFVATLARPGGNITGMFLDLPEIAGKLLELLTTTLPGLRRIAALWDPFTGKAQVAAVEQAAKALGVEVQILEARAGSLAQTVRSAVERRTSALVLLGSPVLSAGFPQIVEATLASRLPSMALLPNFVRLGGLMAYGPDAVDQYRQEGRMIAKIVRGARPAEVPVERPTKFYFLINQKTARTLGLTIPPALLARADQVIE